MGKSRPKPFWAIARNSHVALFTCLIASSLLCQTMHALFLVTVPYPTLMRSPGLTSAPGPARRGLVPWHFKL